MEEIKIILKIYTTTNVYQFDIFWRLLWHLCALENKNNLQSSTT